jgi:Peptidase family M1 domain/Peptidase M1 N-terminal domain
MCKFQQLLHKFNIALVIVVLAGSQLDLTAQDHTHSGLSCAKKHQHRLPESALMPLDLRSDTVDILHTAIQLDITDFANQRIRGSAVLQVQAKMPDVQHLAFDLLQLTVDSVTVPNGQLLSWTYNQQQVTVQLSAPLSTTQSLPITVYYRGKPQQDASGWGGFYWSGQYAYNLGVGFDADPHNYGRVWFPCFDNFVERCSFDFSIVTPPGRRAYCNGLLTDVDTLPSNNLRFHWQLTEPIPSYLTCVAVGPYTEVLNQLNGELGIVPVQLAVAAADSNKLKSSFEHLPEALAAYEFWYGPYRWSKIGYSVVPFTSGAMEHATNIAYMRPAVDGTLGSETLMAHELSHHWWGDLATCTTAEDMWLNEGWASFSEHLFLEWVYGPERYRQAVESNFLQVLEGAHIAEGGYRAVSGVPHELTYGQHVYNKGAVVAHNLRGYLGDDLFRSGIRAVMDQTQMDDWSSAELRDKLSAATGEDLTDFFDNWVFAPGFTDFTIDSVQYIWLPTDGLDIKVWVKQRLRGAPAYYNNVPLEFTLLRQGGQKMYFTAVVSGEQTEVTLQTTAWGGLPQHLWINTRNKLTQARTVADRKIGATGSVSFAPAKLDGNMTNMGADSAQIRVEYHYTAPDTAGTANPNLYALTGRFWMVDGDWDPAWNGTLTFTYDGRGQADQLDRALFLATGPKEDSVRLLYRTGPGHPWAEHPNYTKNTLGSMQDRWGLLRANTLLKGEYTIGKGAGTVAVETPVVGSELVQIAPSLTHTECVVTAETPIASMLVYDQGGRLMGEYKKIDQPTYRLEVADWPIGQYVVVVTLHNQQTYTVKLMRQ